MLCTRQLRLRVGRYSFGYTTHIRSIASKASCLLGIVVSHPSARTTIDHLIAHIQPHAHEQLSETSSTPSQLMVLLTPSFAKQAINSDLPLRILECLRQERGASKPLDAFTAVVDRLPVPEAASEACEGIAYALVVDPVPLRSDSHVSLRRDTTKAGSLLFDLCVNQTSDEHAPATQIQLPLAQTIFSTGLPSTLLHSRYQPGPQDGRLHRSSTKQLESQAFQLPINTALRSLDYHAPLVPLTPVRQIKSSMGNIIRSLVPITSEANRSAFTINGHDFVYDEMTGQHKSQVAEPFPASQELETAVTEYFKALDIPPEPVQVWALVLPHVTLNHTQQGGEELQQLLKLDQESIRLLWTPNADPSAVTAMGTSQKRFMRLRQGRFWQALLAGGRFIKVLSGGGGWGKKAGLLSFDPDTSYSTREIRSEEGWDFSLDSEEALQICQKRALGEVVKEGEIVAFFIARSENPDTAAKQGFVENGELQANEASVIFGSIPSSVERGSPISSISRSGGKEEPSAQHFRGCFGALSEGGMAVTVTKGSVSLTQTKMDMPFGRLVN